MLPKKVQTLIGEFAALEDPLKRTGNLSICNTSAEWLRLLAAGKLHITNSEYGAANVATGSSFNLPVTAVPVEKQNNRILHGPHDHTTHFFAKIIKSIREFWKNCVWMFGCWLFKVTWMN